MPFAEILKKNAEKMRSAFMEYPFTFICAILTTAFAHYTIEILNDSEPEEHKWLVKLLLILGMGISLFFGLETIIKRRKLTDTPKAYILLLSGIAVLSLYYFMWDGMEAYDMIRWFLYSLAFHLLAAVAVLRKMSEDNAFWQFNRLLFSRICVSLLFTGTLMAGLSLAIAALDFLLEVSIAERTYAHLAAFLIGIFNTSFFLAGIPRDPDELDRMDDYPNILRIFSQFVLIPLSFIYLVILYIYGAKILIEWSLPRGLVSTLILAYSVAGTLAILLVHPLRNDTGRKWVRFYTKYFYLLIMPLIVLLYLSIFARIGDYGFTYLRYFGLVLAVWLTGITLYFNFSKEKNIKYIPLSLMIVCFLASLGPWSFYNVSVNSQMEQVRSGMEKGSVFLNFNTGRETELPYDKYYSLLSSVNFLYDNSDKEELRAYIKKSTGGKIDIWQKMILEKGEEYYDARKGENALRERDSAYYQWMPSYKLLDTLGIRSVARNAIKGMKKEYSLFAPFPEDEKDDLIVDIKGYSLMQAFHFGGINPYISDPDTVTAQSSTPESLYIGDYVIHWDGIGREIGVSHGTDTLRIPAALLVKEHLEKEKRVVDLRVGTRKVKLLIQQSNGIEYGNGSYVVWLLAGQILVE